MYIQWLCVRSWMLKIKTLEIKCWKLLILPIVHIHFPLCDFLGFKSLYLSTQNYTILQQLAFKADSMILFQILPSYQKTQKKK